MTVWPAWVVYELGSQAQFSPLSGSNRGGADGLYITVEASTRLIQLERI